MLFGIPAFAAIVVFFVIDFDGRFNDTGHLIAEQTLLFKNGLLNGNVGFDSPLNLYVAFGALISLTGVSTALALQITSFLSFIVLIVYSRRLILEYKREQQGGYLFMVVGITLSPMLMTSSLVVLPVMTAIAFLIGALWHIRSYMRRFKPRDLLFGTLFAGMAIMTETQTIFALIPMVFWMLKSMISHGKPKGVLFALAGSIPFVVYMFMYKIDVSWFLTDNWSFLNYFERSFCTEAGCVSYDFANIFFILLPFGHPGFTILTVFVIYIAFKQGFKREDLFWLSIIIIYLLYLAGLTVQDKQMALLIYPIIVFWLYPKFNALKISKTYTRAIVAVAFIVQMAFMGMYFDEKTSQTTSAGPKATAFLPA